MKYFPFQMLQQQVTFVSRLFINLKSIILFLILFFCVCVPQLGPNIKELFRLVEDFVDVIGLRMKDFQDMYEVTDNLGQPYLHHSYLCSSKETLITALLYSLMIDLHIYNGNT